MVESTCNVEILHCAQIWQNYYIQNTHVVNIYIYRQFSVFTTSVGLTQACPNEKSAIRLTSVGLTHARPNIIHRPEEVLDIQSELIFGNDMVHLPQE